MCEGGGAYERVAVHMRGWRCMCEGGGVCVRVVVHV